MVRQRKFNLPADADAYLAFLSASSARRQRDKKLCVECGAEFVGITKARYCSPRCRVRAHYYAKKSSRRAQEAPDEA
jgi:hypothetical protein